MAKTKKMISYATIRKEWNKDPEFIRIRKEREPLFNVIQQLVRTRVKKGITQAELAEMSGLKQEAISGLERMKREPRLSTTLKVARALDIKQLKIV